MGFLGRASELSVLVWLSIQMYPQNFCLEYQFSGFILRGDSVFLLVIFKV